MLELPKARVYGGGAQAAILPLTANGRIFRAGGEPWRWKGVSAFPLMDLFERDFDINPFLEAFAGFNILRVWPYVTWPGTGWETPAFDDTPRKFADYCAERGFYVEFTLLTDDDPARIPLAREFVEQLRGATNVVLEIGNEPTTHKLINTWMLQTACARSGFLYSSGDYEDSGRFLGTYGTAHTPRDAEWQRKAHDLKEYFEGGGPSANTDPAHRVPWVADEPIRPDQAGFNEQYFRAYFGVASLLGAGATFHYEGGKLGRLPTPEEARCRDAALEGLNAFPADAPLGQYNRPLDSSLRTYVVGNYMVRVPPLTSREGVVPGTMLDDDGILYRL